MDLMILRLGFTLTAFLVCDRPQCCWANENVTQSSASEPMEQHPKNPQALYEVLKKKSEKEQWLNTFNLEVAKEDLINPGRMNLSDVGPEIAMYHFGYLKIKNASKPSDGLYKLSFTGNARELSLIAQATLYRDLIILAAKNDVDVYNALSAGNTTFERMPPESDAVKSFMLALDTIISSIPLRFIHWQHAAIFGAFLVPPLGLTGVKCGNDFMTYQILFLEELSNNTRLLFVVDDHQRNATLAWDSYYKDLMLPILLSRSRKNLLMILVTSAGGMQKNAIEDWYGVYRDPDNRVLQEYKPPQK